MTVDNAAVVNAVVGSVIPQVLTGDRLMVEHGCLSLLLASPNPT